LNVLFQSIHCFVFGAGATMRRRDFIQVVIGSASSLAWSLSWSLAAIE